jgi:hypothetical protein
MYMNLKGDGRLHSIRASSPWQTVRPVDGRRDAKWVVFRPKIPIWVYFGGSWYGKCWYILFPFGLFTAFENILWPFGIFCGHLVHFPPFCLATLGGRNQRRRNQRRRNQRRRNHNEIKTEVA